ncbi:peptide/nickel transport system permease protein [Clostridium saccharoperbutylacetonicum]|uniref:ABC-type dipeptide/oligopeptide/nickel transport system, permease component n=1 Tax=Clostridium saccharoperbutylacetonicum N1-4(HMT) TaxID=931276 RepID=M1MMB3_9CLOT|nr:ABC transporter permease [Clostridium saccharoperbutylacetonicum]AGF55891.1 ABC-type dipeptide/oligopeptide/nickel transport system, permease component [Clostridium saccharoperbutylacetonicum N1-4(HMT)]NRT63370.1 peptide/nickel transport system permease protein [Clostridium saccharoperbutylacetonicum]NSB26732.1 peptide/nickel transport system permease protein [Clostridium saccharoperbutylacetonicum]NSB46083.1 peptide/nickel transport system permease protein [Clostridium saccharoperbutylaceto
MKKYILRRILIMIPTLIGVSILIFFLFAAMPGDYFDSFVRLNPSRLAELKALYGLDQPVIKRYFMWISGVLSGNLGFSLKYQEPVTSLLNKYMWNSFIVAIVSVIISWTAALIIGVASAVKQNSWFDRIITVFVFVFMSFPSFFLGLLMIKFISVDLNILPIGGMIDTGSTTTGFAYILEVGKHMVLPVSLLTLLSLGSLTRYFRSGMIDVIKMDFIRTARAKGLKEKTVIVRHALRNAILPAITLLAFELPGLFSGAIITEQIFNWPGVGHIQLEAVSTRDYPVLMSFTLLLAALTILGNLLADVLYAYADPRIRLK